MCCHVLEHLSRPMEVVEQILDVMPPKAYLYLEVPYENCAVDGKVYIHEHINLFRPQTFFEIFTRKRLRILEYGVAELKTRDGRVFGRHIQCLVRKQRPGMFAVNSTLRRMLAKTAELCALDVQKSPDRICVKLRGRKIFSRTKRG